jgi:DNA repair photolyase
LKVIEGPGSPIDGWVGDGDRDGESDNSSKGLTVGQCEASAALSPSGLEGYDWALNPYIGCSHGCAYCYAPSVLRVDRDRFRNHVEVRRNIPSLLSKELKRKEPGVVGIGTVTDGYQPVERRFQVTRFCLERLLRHDWPVCILTKGDLVVRDLDLIERFSECEVGFTVTTLNEHQRRLLEPGAPSVPRRLAAMRLLSDAGVRTYGFLGPVYPTTSINEVREMVRRVHGAGAGSILVDRLNLKRGVWISVTKALTPDPALMGIARRRMFPWPGDPDFYDRVFVVVQEEAEALGMDVGQA